MPDLVTSSEDEVFRQGLARLRSVLSGAPSSLHADIVNLRAVANVAGILQTPQVQLVPGAGAVMHDISGIGVVRQRFEVHCFASLRLDRTAQDEIRWQNATNGILRIRSQARGNGLALPGGLIHTVLLQEVGGGAVSSPIMLVSFAAPTLNPVDEGWVQCSDTYELIWQAYHPV